MGVLDRLLLGAQVGPQVADEPGGIDDEEADRTDDGDRDLVPARPVADLIREPE